MKRLISLVLCLMLLLSTAIVPAQAVSSANADKLNALGLFKGTANGYDLNKEPTRLHGLIMLIRLLGEEDEALSCTLDHPFADVTSGANYVAYAYNKGYTAGTSATTFTPNSPMNFKAYTTFLLRALGYNSVDYNQSLNKAAELGMIDTATSSMLNSQAVDFYRADMVDLSLAALTTYMTEGGVTLAQKLVNDGVFSEDAGRTQGVIGGKQLTFSLPIPDPTAITKVSGSYALPSGTVSADVITVNIASPSISVETRMVNNRLGNTAKFGDIVAASSADVVINGNFFAAYSKFQTPIGHTMVDGEFLFGSSGITSFGFTEDGEIRVGRPAVFFYVTQGSYSWACYELNTAYQGGSSSVVYTPAYGTSVPITGEGTITVVSNGTIQNVYAATIGSSVEIPRDGFVMHFGPGFTSTSYYKAPEVGSQVTLEPKLVRQDDSFVLDGVRNIVSGAPRLVENGQICTTLEAGFQEARFTTMTTSRTAIGKLPNGKLVIVSTGAATIQQMRELMLQLGCVEAVNLDGGASTALAYQGKVLRRPGRELTTTLHIFTNKR